MKLTAADVRALNRARTVLAAIGRESQKAGVALLVSEERPRLGLSIADAYDYGQLTQAAEHAGDAVFNVLNVAKNIVGLPLSDAQVHNR